MRRFEESDGRRVGKCKGKRGCPGHCPARKMGLQALLEAERSSSYQELAKENEEV
jgi:hypothetical protein